MKLYVIEKKEKIGEIYGESIFTWNFHVLVREESLESYCKERGYYLDWEHGTLDYNLRFSEYYL